MHRIIQEGIVPVCGEAAEFIIAFQTYEEVHGHMTATALKYSTQVQCAHDTLSLKARPRIMFHSLHTNIQSLLQVWR